MFKLLHILAAVAGVSATTHHIFKRGTKLEDEVRHVAEAH